MKKLFANFPRPTVRPAFQLISAAALAVASLAPCHGHAPAAKHVPIAFKPTWTASAISYHYNVGNNVFRLPSNALNATPGAGLGLTLGVDGNDLCNVEPNTMWLTFNRSPGHTTSANGIWWRVDFNEEVILSAVKLWNYNETIAVQNFPRRGVKDVDAYVSLAPNAASAGPTQIHPDATPPAPAALPLHADWTFAGSFTFAPAPGTANYTGDIIRPFPAPVRARSLLLYVKTSQHADLGAAFSADAYCGFAKIRFYDPNIAFLDTTVETTSSAAAFEAVFHNAGGLAFDCFAAALAGNADPGDDPADWAAAGAAFSAITNLAAGAITLDVNGLNAGTLHTARLFATNGAFRAAGNPFPVTTKSGAPIVRAAAATDVAELTAIANGWLDWAGSESGSADVVLFWGEADDPGPPASWQGAPVATNQTAGAIVLPLDNLFYFTGYKYCLAATNGNDVAVSETIHFKTTGAPAFNGTSCSLPTPGSVKVNADIASCAPGAGTATVSCWFGPAADALGEVFSWQGCAAATNLSHTVSGQPVGGTYFYAFKIRAQLAGREWVIWSATNSVVANAPATGRTVTWNNAAAVNNHWDAATPNWLNTSSQPVTFQHGDSVAFAPVANLAVDVRQATQANAVTVAVPAGVVWTLGGAAPPASLRPISLALSGAGEKRFEIPLTAINWLRFNGGGATRISGMTLETGGSGYTDGFVTSVGSRSNVVDIADSVVKCGSFTVDGFWQTINVERGVIVCTNRISVGEANTTPVAEGSFNRLLVTDSVITGATFNVGYRGRSNHVVLNRSKLVITGGSSADSLTIGSVYYNSNGNIMELLDNSAVTMRAGMMVGDVGSGNILRIENSTLACAGWGLNIGRNNGFGGMTTATCSNNVVIVGRGAVVTAGNFISMGTFVNAGNNELRLAGGSITSNGQFQFQHGAVLGVEIQTDGLPGHLKANSITMGEANQNPTFVNDLRPSAVRGARPGTYLVFESETTVSQNIKGRIRFTPPTGHEDRWSHEWIGNKLWITYKPPRGTLFMVR